jgi:hypothetical protein
MRASLAELAVRLTGVAFWSIKEVEIKGLKKFN